MAKIKTVESKKDEIAVEMIFDKQEWDTAVDAVYKKNAGKFKVQGFRAGKAPRKMIEQQYGDSVFMQDAIHDLFTVNFEKYLDEKPEIHLADYPHLDFGFEKDGGIKMTATADIDPTVKLGKYTGLEIKKTEIKIGDKEIDDYISRMRENRAKQVAADKGYKIADGDCAVIDFAGSIDGKYFDGGTAKNYELVIGSHSFIGTFETQLVGLKVGDKKDVMVSFPADYGAKELAGKPAKFEVTVNNILCKVLPAVDDDFAKEVSEFNNLAEYRKDIKKKLTEGADAQAKMADEEKMYQAVVDNATVEIPDKMVERHLDEMMHDMEHKLSHQGATLEQYAQYMGMTVEQMREKQKPAAKIQVKMRLVIDAIIDKEKLHDKNRQKQFEKAQTFLQKNNKMI